MTEEPKKPRKPHHRRTPDPEWNNQQLAFILGTDNTSLGRLRNGLRYPEVEMMLKIEMLFGWPASEQIALIPFRAQDTRYSMVLNSVIAEWSEANPRTEPAAGLRSRFGPKEGMKPWPRKKASE